MHEDTVTFNAPGNRLEKLYFQQQTDRLVINIQPPIFSKGNSVLNVLQKSPGVKINDYNNTIILNGKIHPEILMNGKVVRKSREEIYGMLEKINAESLERIELLTVRPGKYKKDGGVINIIFKKNEEMGTAGSFSVTGGWGMYPKAGITVNVNHRAKYLNIYGSYSYSYDKTYSETIAHGAFQFPNDIGKGERSYYYYNETRPERKKSSANIGLNYIIDKKTTIGANVVVTGIFQTYKGFTSGDYTIYRDSLLLLRSDTHEKYNVRSAINSINVERILDNKSKLNVYADYIHYKNYNPSTLFNSFLSGEGKDIAFQSPFFFPQRQVLNQSAINLQAYKIVYERKVNASTSIEAGSKVSDSKITNIREVRSFKNGIWTRDNVISGVANVNESLKAVYSLMNINVKKTILNLGLRYEHLTFHISNDAGIKQDISRKYSYLLPSFLVRRVLSDNSMVKLTYNRTMRMPSQNEISSPVSYADIYAVSVGNPFLKPVIADRLEVILRLKQKYFSVILNREKNAIIGGAPTESPTDSIFYSMSHNLKYLKNVTLRTYLPVSITSWWQMNISLIGAWNEYKTQLVPGMNFINTAFTNNYFTYNIYNNHSFTLPEKISVDLSAGYNSSYWWGVYRGIGFGVVELAIQKELKHQANIQLSASDLLMSTRNHNYFEIPNQAYQIRSNMYMNPESRKAFLIKLTYTKSFGNNKVKEPRRWGMAAQEESNRIANLQ
jgi:hypothetical protein